MLNIYLYTEHIFTVYIFIYMIYALDVSFTSFSRFPKSPNIQTHWCLPFEPGEVFIDNHDHSTEQPLIDLQEWRALYLS